MMTRSKDASAPGFPRAILLAGCLLTLVVLLGAGCAHSHRPESPGAALGSSLSSKPPLFLTGPAAVLLTNSDGFGARVTFTSGWSSNPARAESGQLFARQGKLYFEPDPDDSSAGKSRAGRLSFIWDVAGNSGLVLSEPLQGYAPLTSTVLLTNLVVQPARGAAERIEGHPAEQATATVMASDGTATEFQVLRATDLNGVPVRITARSDSGSMLVVLSKIRREAPPVEVFRPPDGFTKYESQEAMMNELLSRLQNVRRSIKEPIGPIPAVGEGRGSRPRGGYGAEP